MKACIFQTATKLFNDTFVQSLVGQFFKEKMNVRKLRYWNGEKKIQIFQEAKMNESPFSPKMGRL